MTFSGTRRVYCTALAKLIVGLIVGLSGTTAFADIVNIAELTEGSAGVQVLSGGIDVTSFRVTILPDTVPDFLHFKLVTDNPVGTGDLAFSNLFEDQIGGVLSDRIVIFFDPNAVVNGLDIKFCSDPLLSLCDGNFTFHYPFDAVENGQFQHVADAFNTFDGDGVYNFFASSDVDIPEPGTITLTLIGAFLLGYSRRPRKHAMGARRSQP